MIEARRLAVAALCALAVGEGAEAVTFTRIAGSGDPVPGAQGDTLLEVLGAQLAGDWIVARGYSANESGIFVWRGEDAYRVIVHTTDLPGIPSDAELVITNPAYYDIDETGRVIVAVGWYLPDDPDPASTGGAGVWLWENGQFELLILSGTTAHSSDRPFIAAMHPVLANGEAYFSATEGSVEDFAYAIYRWTPGGGVTRVVGPGFVTVSWPRLGGARFAFAGLPNGGPFALWSALPDGSDIGLELDLSSPFPGGSPGSTWHLISGGGQPAITAPPITFPARSSGDFDRQALFRLRGSGDYEILFDAAELDPTSGLPHGGIQAAGIAGSGENIAFMLEDPTQQSTLGRRLIVRDSGGSYHLMAAEGREFEGLHVGLIEFLHGGMDGNRFAFNLLRPGDGAVWVADFGPTPPPSLEIPTVDIWSLLALAVALAFLGAGRLGGRRA